MDVSLLASNLAYPTKIRAAGKAIDSEMEKLWDKNLGDYQRN